MSENQKSCPLCSAEAVLRYRGMKGYIEDFYFDVYECSSCEASFVDPLKTDEKVYNYIYEQADKMPGYERYYRYSELVKKVKDPLWYLCNAESVYWSVKKALEENYNGRKDLSILEIGSGLGYLTYSLNRAGYKTVGIDVSKEAAAKACKKYGNFYESGDLFEIARTRKGTYDCVIMTEIIEHVEDPKAFIGACLSLLRKEGKLIVTTPNKSAAPAESIWQSDIPPVHLWFLSEKSMSAIAKDFGKKCSFIDFTEYTKKFYGPAYESSMEQIQAGLPRIMKNGKIVPGREADNIKSVLFGIKGRYWLSYIRRRLKTKIVSRRTTTLCAVFA